MKKLLILSLLLLNIAATAQSSQDQQDKQWRLEMTKRNGFPEPPKYPTSPWLYGGTSRTEEVMKSFPIIIPPRNAPELTKEEIEELHREEERVNAIRTPHEEDIAKYGEFLRKKNTGIFRLFPDLGCGTKLLVNASDDCAKVTSLSWSYSFIYRYHGNADGYDLRLKGENLFVDGFLSQSILTPLGDVDLNLITLTSNGMKFLTEFKPEKKSKKAKEQFAQIAKRINADGYVYGKTVNFNENQTYAMRLAAYQVAERHKLQPTDHSKIWTEEERKFYWLQNAKRRDIVLAFRVIRKDTDGSVTILWKELVSRKAPILSFDKGEKLTDLKVIN